LGFIVSGIDRAAALIATAKEMLPTGDFSVADACELTAEPKVEVILAQSVFQYFPSTEYASEVLARMANKARRVVAVLDLPDIDYKKAELSERHRLAGGEAAYAERYAGLEHLCFDRSEIAELLRKLGLTDVRIQTQQMGGQDSAVFRFNAWGFRGKECERGLGHT
jgi:trans-aconitate methyltransferase